MKVLFVPIPEGGPSHLIPLLALNNMLSGTSIKTAFLLTQPYHKLIRQLGVNVLDIPHRRFSDNGFRSEMQAYGKFAPDVVVDDSSLTTGFATTLCNIKRVTMQRTGIFPGEKHSNSNHVHSGFPADIRDLPDASFLGLPRHKTLTDFFKAKHKIVPGIRSIEVLPPDLQNDPSYHYSGPLLMSDLFIQQFGQVGLGAVDINNFKSFDPLSAFWEKHRQRRIVYMTFGLVAKASSAIRESIRYMLAKGLAVISNIKMEDLSPEQEELFYFGSYLPMHTVCSNVDLMIHACGNGTYHYPILHNVPSITIGTQSFDREEVALRLAEYGVSVHLPAPAECDNFGELFQNAIEKYFDSTGAFMAEKKQKLTSFNEEIKETASAFDFEKILHL